MRATKKEVRGVVPAAALSTPRCRFCRSELTHSVINLGMSPFSNSFLTKDKLLSAEEFYPLEVFVCDSCFLVQLAEFRPPEDIFSDYVYLSSYSQSWLEHCKRYVQAMTERFGVDKSWKVMEVASNDGCLLQYFIALGIPVTGIEPAANVAQIAIERGVPTVCAFLGEATAKTISSNHGKANLIVGNNVLAHVPDVNDFVIGLRELLASKGIITMELPHVAKLLAENQFDTIYHEHFSYFSFSTVKKIFEANQLELFDVAELPTHGGSLRIFARHAGDESRPIATSVGEFCRRELKQGVFELDTYLTFAKRIRRLRVDLLRVLTELKEQDKTIVAYGAAAKGNTLLNYCAIGSDIIEYAADRNPLKHGKYLPGSHIPVYPPEKIQETKPDYIFVSPWNIQNEIIKQLSFTKAWGCKFIVPVPAVRIIE